MTAEIFTDADFVALTNPGAVQPRHAHEAVEQVWIALSGSGLLLLDGSEVRQFAAGQVARFAAGTVHGFENIGAEPFEYMSVTLPPLDHSYANSGRGEGNEKW